MLEISPPLLTGAMPATLIACANPAVAVLLGVAVLGEPRREPAVSAVGHGSAAPGG